MKEVEFKLSDELKIKFAHVSTNVIQVYQLDDGTYMIEYDDQIPEDIIESIQDQILDSMKPKKVKNPRRNFRGRKVLIPCRKYG